MSATRPLFPLPMAETPVGESYEAGRRRDKRDGTLTMYGRCAWFCQQDLPDTPVAEHGAYCTTSAILTADLVDAAGDEAHLWGHLVASYLNGVYPDDVYRSGQPTYVELALTAVGVQPDDEAGEAKRLFVTPPIARSIAAALVRMADEAEMLHPLPHLER